MNRFQKSRLNETKIFLLRNKFLIMLFCASVMIIYAANSKFSFLLKTLNMRYTKGAVSAQIDKKRNSSTLSLAENKKQSSWQYISVSSPITVSLGKPSPLHQQSLQVYRKQFSDEHEIPRENEISFTRLFANYLNIQPDVPSHFVEFYLNHPQLCPNKGANLTILIAICTAVDHEEARSAIRDTWGGYATDRGIKLLFFVGIPGKSELNERLIKENRKFQDLIQSNFLDTYNNLTLKSVSILKWATEYCSEVKYVIKVDDDVILNVERYLTLTSNNISNSLMGYIFKDLTPFRNKESKHYVSYAAYPFAKFPDFVYGPTYLISGDVVQLLYNATIKIIHATLLPFYNCEDVYVAGFAAEMTGVKRISLKGVFFGAQDIQPCNFQNIFNSAPHSPQNIRQKWILLKKSNFTCKN